MEDNKTTNPEINETTQQQPENAQPKADTETAKTENAGNKKKEEQPKSSFTVEPIEFPEVISSIFMNSSQIRNKIDDMLRAVLADYVGCEIKIHDGQNKVIGRFVMPGCAYVNLIFRQNDDAPGYKALKRITPGDSSDLFGRISRTLGANASRGYKIDEFVLEALEDFFPVDKKVKKAINDWDARIVEIQQGVNGFSPAGFNYGGYIDVVVMGLPLEMLLAKIYGTGEDGSISYVASAIMSTRDLSTDLVFNISRMGNKGVQALGDAMRIQQAPTMYPGMPAMTMSGYNGQAATAPNMYTVPQYAPGNPWPNK